MIINNSTSKLIMLAIVPANPSASVLLEAAPSAPRPLGASLAFNIINSPAVDTLPIIGYGIVPPRRDDMQIAGEEDAVEKINTIGTEDAASVSMASFIGLFKRGALIAVVGGILATIGSVIGSDVILGLSAVLSAIGLLMAAAGAEVVRG